MEFASLHNHTYFSLLDCPISPEELVQQAYDFRYKAVAISDHGSMHSFIRGYKKAKELGIKYIAAVEAYETTDMYYKDKEADRYHLILLAKNDIGLRNLFKIVTESNINGFYVKPRVDRNLLRKYSEGIICTSSCLGGIINKTLGWKLNEVTTELRWNTAKKLVNDYKQIFGDNFYIELQSHDTPSQDRANKQLLQLARETQTKFILTFDSHIKSESEVDRNAHALFIQTAQNRDVSDDDAYQDLLETYSGCWQQSEDEIYRTVVPQIGKSALDEAIRNTYELSQQCNIEIQMGKTLMPQIDIPSGFKNEQEYLKHLVNIGWKKRGFHKFGKEKQEIYKKRLQEEFEVLDYLGYCGYFIMLNQLIGKMKERQIPLGYSRGSGGNVLTLYTIGVTEVDSIRWDLDFSRFANKGRLGSVADYDIDISKRRRQEALDIASELFGDDHVCQVATFNSMSPKVCIRDIGKALDENGTYSIPYSLRDKISKLIPNDPSGKMTIEKALELSSDLRKYEKQFPLLFEYTRHLQNVPKSVGCHAAAVLITPEITTNYFPLMLNKDGKVMSQLEMHNAMDDLGCTKMDFLGLNTVDVVDDTLKLSNMTWDDIDLAIMDLDDKNVFNDIYGTGKTAGIFQMETHTPQKMFQNMMPDVSIEDVFAVNSLNRPAILSVGMDNVYIHNKKHPEDVEYLHPDLEKILGKTMGVLLYQESVLEIFRLAGFPEEQVDEGRRSIGKKLPEVMVSLYEEFKQGLLNKQWDQQQIDDLWAFVEAQAGYGFNRGHSCAYGLLSYVTAYLKYHHPKEFMTALLISETGNYDQLTKYISESKNMGIEVLPPNINISGRDFTVSDDGILFGLLGIKGVGESAVDKIIEERSNGLFINVIEFKERTNVDISTVVALIQSGAFGTSKIEILKTFAESQFEWKEFKPVKSIPSKKVLLENDVIRSDEEFKNKELCLSRWNDLKRNRHEITQKGKYDKYIYEFEEKYLSNTEMFEFNTLSIFLTNNPFDGYESYFKPLNEAEDSKQVLLGGVITKIQNKKQKDGKRMGYIDVLSPHGIIECVLFSSVYSDVQDVIVKGNKIVALCKVSSSQCVVNKIKTFEQWKSERYEREQIS